MLRKRRKATGQSITEFITLITIVIAVFVAMQIYIKRGIQGRWKAAIDDLGEQYDPLAANSNLRTLLISATNTDVITSNDIDGYWTKRTDHTISTERKEGYLGSGPYNFFGPP